jgi:calmodulin
MEIMEPPKSLISASANISVGVGVEKPISDSSLNVNINMETASDDLCPNSNLEAGTAVSAPDLFLTEAFNNADVDGDGKLSYKELKDLLQSLGLEEDELKLNEFVRAVDKDNDGTIDLVEFQSIIDKLSTKASSFEQHLREMFELYDDDGSGGIDQHELRSLMAQLGVDLTDEELSAMIAEADADGDGDIDYEEFVAMFKGIKVSGEEKKQQQQQQKRVVLQRKDSITGGIFDDAKQLMSFTSIFRFVTWLYSERKMILLASSHFVATMVIWGECAFYCLEPLLKYVSYLLRVVSY